MCIPAGKAYQLRLLLKVHKPIFLNMPSIIDRLCRNREDVASSMVETMIKKLLRNTWNRKGPLKTQ